jgi:hypothetical protein
VGVFEKGPEVKLFAEFLGSGRRMALLAGAMMFAMLAVLAVAARADATETIFWDNYRDNPATIGSADMTGSGGGLVNLGGLGFETTEGMAYDPVTNRLYVAAEGSLTNPDGAIVVINLDGSGASFFSAPGLDTESPEGIALDPTTRMMYWVNTGDDTIGWAKLDGSAAGVLNTAGAPTEGYYRIALDPASGRVFWSADVEKTKEVIAWANVNNTGGGTLTSEISEGPDGLATNPLNNRLYMVSGTKTGTLSSVSLSGGPVESVPLTTGFHSGYGLAIDPVAGVAYWGNYGLTKSQSEAIGFSSLAGTSGGSISPTTTPVNGAQDPVIVRSPTGTGAPQITQSKAALSCSLGSWAPDYPGAFVYQGPTSYTYQWYLNGAPIAGATAATLAATTPGSYSCAVTGHNPSGSATQSAAAGVTVTPATLSGALKSKKVQAKAGKAATVKFTVANAGDLASAPLQMCPTLNKHAKTGLVTPQCALVRAVAPGASAVATMKVKTKKTAKGTYKFTARVKGTTAKPVTVRVKVIGAKKHKKKHHRK